MDTRPSLGLLTIGSEILDGRVVNSNCSELSKTFEPLGFRVVEVLSCDDVEEEIVRALAYLFGHCDAVVATGGLGPTTDDLTREAAAAYFGRPLELDETALAGLRAFFERRGRPWIPTNGRQAYRPAGSVSVPNPVGSAPGFAVRDGGRAFLALPGVPRELRAMTAETGVGFLCDAFPGRSVPARAEARLFGLPESAVGQTVESRNLPDWVKVSYRASFPEVHLVLSGAGPGLAELAEDVLDALGRRHVVSRDLSVGLREAALGALRRRGWSLAVAEVGSPVGVVDRLAGDDAEAEGLVTGASFSAGGGGPPDDPIDVAEKARRTHGAPVGVGVVSDEESFRAAVVTPAGSAARSVSRATFGAAAPIRTYVAATVFDLLRA